jgi:hypothetical protein
MSVSARTVPVIAESVLVAIAVSPVVPGSFKNRDIYGQGIEARLSTFVGYSKRRVPEPVSE